MSAVHQTDKAQKSVSRVTEAVQGEQRRTSRGPVALKHSLPLHYRRDTITLPAKTPVNSHPFSKSHVPAAQCDTIRSWLCVNQMMTARPVRLSGMLSLLVSNPLPRERGNWFPGPPVGMLLPSSCIERLQVSSVRNFSECIHRHRYFSGFSDPQHFVACKWEELISCCTVRAQCG